ncbi:MAG: hypothetical protein TQ37_00470 [Candidatus Synechococcus spongiarum 15L]|uniref:Chlororespiratory reduction protein 7 n=2 Tax=Candidatus Synechococcus spongiarum TaxID=431041 RepID=A0A1T1D444_9SYNE|nr:chlororespiratory reduction protein 7 [Candidatus Synechococcus spongiarum]KKZ14624.1 MAG: hypothetical protein TQ37_00470 [Candidatus Synechococcus spongiarum 15L]MCY4359335.1 chlororespiratory reduction protein 7 [Cyanobacteria bacterium MAG APA_bin_95]OOV35614.1 hypothetical protein BV53_03565 [Candidatus Synechococcus spongiarum LMB bulk15N]
MADPIIRAMDHYVILEPGKAEWITDRTETEAWLTRTLAAMDHVPDDLHHLPDGPAQAAHLLDTACELEVAPGQRVQWYAVRLDRDSGSVH